ncbi:hypothetical protein HI914_07340 [Erysiphe necator]|uniref:Uncharacterized protein n=1 Tax=Uncinula necator TaxID=52586 RepID=A0A0B1P7S1_UNCNE|nr:hypothetical protein HI914_07340 [Erysiphe necator]KHJ33385.1 hypothetical protein EV44_g3642 [Erysiphe necator]
MDIFKEKHELLEARQAAIEAAILDLENGAVKDVSAAARAYKLSEETVWEQVIDLGLHLRWSAQNNEKLQREREQKDAKKKKILPELMEETERLPLTATSKCGEHVENK